MIDNDNLDISTDNFKKIVHNQKKLINLYKLFKYRDKKITLVLNLISHLVLSIVPSSPQYTKSINMVQSLMDELNDTFSSEGNDFGEEIHYSHNNTPTSAYDLLLSNFENIEKMFKSQSQQLSALQNNDSFILDSLNIKDKEINHLSSRIENLKNEAYNKQPISVSNPKKEALESFVLDHDAIQNLEKEKLHLTNRNNLLKEEVSQLLDEVKKLKKENASLESKNSLPTNSDEANFLKKEIATKEQDIDRLKNEIRTIGIKNRDLQNELDKVKSQPEDQTKYINKINELQTKLLNVESNEKNFDSTKKEIDFLKGQNEHLSLEIGRLKTEMLDAQIKVSNMAGALKLEMEKSQSLILENESLKRSKEIETSNSINDSFQNKYERIRKELERRGVVEIEKGIYLK